MLQEKKRGIVSVCRRASAFLLAAALVVCLGSVAVQAYYAEAQPGSGPDDPVLLDRLNDLISGPPGEDELEFELFFWADPDELEWEGGDIWLTYGLHAPWVTLPEYDDFFVTIDRDGETLLVATDDMEYPAGAYWGYKHLWTGLPENNTGADQTYQYNLRVWYKPHDSSEPEPGPEPQEQSEAPTIDFIANRATEATGEGISGATVYVITPNGATTGVPVDQDGVWTLSYPARFAAGQIVYAYQIEPGKDPSDTVNRVVGNANRIFHREGEGFGLDKYNSAFYELLKGEYPDLDEYILFEEGVSNVTVTVKAKEPEQVDEPAITGISADPSSFDHNGGTTRVTIAGEHLNLYGSLQIRNDTTGKTEAAILGGDNESAYADFALPPNTAGEDKTYLFVAVADGADGLSTSVVVRKEKTANPGPDPGGPDPNPGPEPDPDPDPKPNPDPDPDPDPKPNPDPGPDPNPDPEPGPDPDPSPDPDPDPETPYPTPGEETEDKNRGYSGGGHGSGFRGSGQKLPGPPIFDILEHQAEMATSGFLQGMENGGTPDAPVVAVQNAGYLSEEQLRRAATGAREGRTLYWQQVDVTLFLDTTSQAAEGLRLEGRIYLNPEFASVGIHTGVSVSGSEVEARRDALRRELGDDSLEVVRLGQQGTYGTTVEIAADVDLSGLNPSSLYVYRSDPETGELERITSGVQVDAAGFLHFKTREGGDIVVAGAPL